MLNRDEPNLNEFWSVIQTEYTPTKLKLFTKSFICSVVVTKVRRPQEPVSGSSFSVFALDSLSPFRLSVDDAGFLCSPIFPLPLRHSSVGISEVTTLSHSYPPLLYIYFLLFFCTAQRFSFPFLDFSSFGSFRFSFFATLKSFPCFCLFDDFRFPFFGPRIVSLMLSDLSRAFLVCSNSVWLPRKLK